MNNYPDTDLHEYSSVLVEGLRDVAADLRTIDLVDMVSYIRFASFATLEDLVHSSTELFFRPGTLSFAWTAFIDIGWNEPPVITLGMEFRHREISVFFDLTLRTFDETVDVSAIIFEDPLVGPEEKVAGLRHAIAEARVWDRSALPTSFPVQLRRTSGP